MSFPLQDKVTGGVEDATCLLFSYLEQLLDIRDAIKPWKTVVYDYISMQNVIPDFDTEDEYFDVLYGMEKCWKRNSRDSRRAILQNSERIQIMIQHAKDPHTTPNRDKRTLGALANALDRFTQCKPSSKDYYKMYEAIESFTKIRDAAQRGTLKHGLILEAQEAQGLNTNG